MAGAGVRPCLALLAVSERRSDEGHEACPSLSGPHCQMVTGPGASAGCPSQGHGPPSGKWLWHEMPTTLGFSFHPLTVPRPLLLPAQPQATAEGLEVLGTRGCSGRAGRASTPPAPVLAVLPVSLVGPSFLWKPGCSVELGASGSRIRGGREGDVCCQGGGYSSLWQMHVPPFLPALHQSTCANPWRRAGLPEVPVRADLLPLCTLQVATTSLVSAEWLKADI